MFHCQYFCPQSPKLSLSFWSHKEACACVSRNMHNPHVKNIVVVFIKKKKNLNYTKVKGKTSPEAILVIYCIKKEVLVHL